MPSIFKIFSLCCFLSIICVGAQTPSYWATGSVWAKPGKGLKNVMVSNGDTIVKTRKNGSFKIPVKPGQVVFPVLPSGYKYANTKKWWYNVADSLSAHPEIKIDFSLKKNKTAKSFRFLAIGDIQVGDNQELLQATRSVMQELLNRNDYEFSIYLGDLVNDSPNLFAPLKKMIDGLNRPSWAVYGNHDRNFKAQRTNQSNQYRKYFGPETYAFFKNNVLFVSLNSLTPVGKYGYKNQYPKNQFKFLSQLLNGVSYNQPIVISQHIPLVRMKNKEVILKILSPYKNILFLTGHTHTIAQNYIKTASGHTIHELTVGAVCGNWWRGQKDWEGVPLSLMGCGAPRGYFEINFNKEKYKIKYKGVGLPGNKQFSIWQGAYNGSPLAVLSNSSDLYVNVFSGSERTRVSLKLSDNTNIVLKREFIMDPFVNYIKQSQKEGLSPDKNSKKAPYLSRKSPHIWKAVLPSTLKKGYHKVQITIADPMFKTIEQSLWLYKE